MKSLFSKSFCKLLLLLYFLNSYDILAQPCSTGSNLVYNPSWHSKTTCPGIMYLDLKVNFGAVGNGSTLDQAAFEAAATFINARKGDVDLVIPAGTYLVGAQAPGVYAQDGQTYGNVGHNPFLLNDCDGVTIHGTGNPLIKFKDGLKIGTFGGTGSLQYLSFIGSTFYFFKCSNITLRDIDIDGNSDNYILGGIWGGTGYQVEAHGVFILDSRNISISGMNILHMGTDGIGITDVFPSNYPTDNIALANLHISYSGRNGLSWTAGTYLTAVNCNFSYSSKGTIKSFPKSGVDIETEGAVPGTGTFTNCTFDNNEVGLQSSAPPGSTKPYSVNLIDCKYMSNSTLQIQLYESNNWSFTNCEFYGSSRVFTDGLTFNKCLFQNCFNGSIFSQPTYKFLLDNSATNCLIDNCTFNNYDDENSFHAFISTCSTNVTTINNSVFNVFKDGVINNQVSLIGDAGTSTIIKKANINYKAGVSPASLTACLTGGGQPLVINQFPAGFVVPGCSNLNCVPNLTITNSLYAPNFVYKASSTITASSTVDLVTTSSVANGYIKYAAEGSVILNPGFDSKMSNTSFFDAYIKPCSQVTVLGRSASSIKTANTKSLVQQEVIQKNMSISIYPNPTSESFIIVAKYDLQNTRIQLFDLSGKEQKIFESNLTNNSKKIRCLFLVHNIYILKLTSKNKTEYSKIIIRR